jgi:nucleotide-binding universal stress UspA family protein
MDADIDSAAPRIVVGVDGSAGSRVALVWALAEAARRGATVEVVSVFPVDVYWLDPFLVDHGRIDAVRADTEALARAMVDDVRRGPSAGPADGVDVRVQVLPGTPSPTLVQRSEGAALLVVGSRGRSAVRSAFGGSVALHCAAHARCSVVVVHPSPAHADEPPRVVVGLDDSSHGRAALAAAVQHAARLDARVDAVLAYEPPGHWSEVYADLVMSTEETRQETLERGRRIVTDVLGTQAEEDDRLQLRAVEGPPVAVLLREASGARLLVVGSHSRNPLEGLVLGSVALHCVATAPCPVLVVRADPHATTDEVARAGAAAAALPG